MARLYARYSVFAEADSAVFLGHAGYIDLKSLYLKDAPRKLPYSAFGYSSENALTNFSMLVSIFSCFSAMRDARSVDPFSARAL